MQQFLTPTINSIYHLHNTPPPRVRQFLIPFITDNNIYSGIVNQVPGWCLTFTTTKSHYIPTTAAILLLLRLKDENRRPTSHVKRQKLLDYLWACVDSIQIWEQKKGKQN